jgi:alkanesulfonate monooxygenase SsuD/methylene tetrahydromethanopterin reductase-like flavin-dependent oxidoreductase (luciferase family)
VLELQALLDTPPAGRTSDPRGARRGHTNVPLWILGSSLFGAQLAAMLGLPYAFASHFAPDALQALDDLPPRISSRQRSSTGPT